jgi:DNA-binding transcriptional ArsR family regulator
MYHRNMVTSTGLDGSILEECRDLANSWAPALRALGHPERLLIILWLANTSCTVRQLQEVTGLQQSLVSYHLRELARAGLVAATPVGRTNQYRLSSTDLDALATVLGSIPSQAAGQSGRQ